jgi:hypothetical protein
MTVFELIKILEEQPKDLIVVRAASLGEWVHVEPISEVIQIPNRESDEPHEVVCLN